MSGPSTPPPATRPSRNQIVEKYLSLVGYAVSRVVGKLPPQVDREELHSFGYLGLIDAVEKFDPGREVKFETYGLRRIHGAILDWLRANDFLPRSVRSKARSMDTATSALEHEHGRTPTIQEVADRAGMTVEEAHELRATLDAVPTVTLSTGRTRARASPRTWSTRPPKPTLGCSMSTSRCCGCWPADSPRSPDGERDIAVLHYFRGMTFTEIGETIGMSGSRVCQLHPAVIRRLSLARC